MTQWSESRIRRDVTHPSAVVCCGSADGAFGHWNSRNRVGSAAEAINQLRGGALHTSRLAAGEDGLGVIDHHPADLVQGFGERFAPNPQRASQGASAATSTVLNVQRDSLLEFWELNLQRMLVEVSRAERS